MPEIALVCTTVKVPAALELYRAIGPHVRIYVIGDDGAPDAEIAAFCNRIHAMYYTATDQRRFDYKCSDLLRWRDPARRSLGCLEAVKHGADIVIMADDDNLPVSDSYFHDHAHALDTITPLEFGEQLLGWADPWAFLQPRVRHRGFPWQFWNPQDPPVVAPAHGLRVGVNAGAVLGDPDIDAAERMTSAPTVMTASPLLDAGVSLAPGVFAPFNAQNTAFRRELLPVMCMLAPAGRCLDIWAAYVAERVMWETGWCVRYGRPYVWQQRNEHDLAVDVAAELRGMHETIGFTNALRDIVLPSGDSVLATAFAAFRCLPDAWADVSELGCAWIADCERVMG